MFIYMKVYNRYDYSDLHILCALRKLMMVI